MNAEEIKHIMMEQAASFGQDVQRKTARLADDRCFPNDMFRKKLGGGNPSSAAPLGNATTNAAPQAVQQAPSAPMTMAEKILALRGASNKSLTHYRKN